MAADDIDRRDRTEEPSPRRLREARLDGRIARSPDLVTACLMLAAAAAVTLAGGAGVRTLGSCLAASLDPSRPFTDPAALESAAFEGLLAGASIVLPAACGLVMVAWLAGIGQVGLVFTTRTVAPRAARLSPAANLAGLVSGRALRRLATDAVKVAAVVGATWWVLERELARIVGLALRPAAEAAAGASVILVRVGLAAGLALLAVGIVDWLLERRRLGAELRMTPREAAEERKEEEGDPAWRRRRLEFARGLGAAPAVAARAATVVIIGGEAAGRRFTIAVAVDIPARGEPRILAVGRAAAAERLAGLASAAGTPVVEDDALARSLAAPDAVSAAAVRDALLERLACVPGLRHRLADGEAAA